MKFFIFCSNIILFFFILSGCEFTNNLQSDLTKTNDTQEKSVNAIEQKTTQTSKTQTIAEYCTEQLGAKWKNFQYEPQIADYQDKTTTEIRDEYHQDINQLFDAPLQKMLKIVEANTALDQLCTDKSITQKIKQSVSTYEISQKAFCRYTRYKYVLEKKSEHIMTERIDDPDIKAFLKNAEDNLTTDYYNALELYQQDIENELEIAKISLENTLAVYDEMVLMYPLHLRLRCIISDLLIFRKDLAKLVNIFYCLERYINAGSDKID